MPVEASPQTLIYPAARLSTIAYSVAFVALGLSAAALGPALPALAQQTNTRLAEIGFLFIGRSFGYMLGSLGAGKLVDRLSGHLLLSAILLLMSAMLFLAPLTPFLWLLTCVLVLLGIAEGGLDISANLLLVWIHRLRATPFLNALHFCFGVGALLAPILVARAILVRGDILWAFWILALYPLPISIWLLRLPSPGPPQASRLDQPAAAHWQIVLLVSLVFFGYVGAEVGYGGWIYTYASSLDLVDPAGAALLTSVFWGALTAGRLLAIPLSTRLKPIPFLLIDLAGCLLSLALIWLFPAGLIALWIGTIGLGLFMASIFPTLFAFTGGHVSMSGQVTRWLFVGTGLGGMFLPWLLGVLIDFRGPALMIPAIWLDLLLTLLLFLLCLILVRKNPSPAQEPAPARSLQSSAE